MTTRPSSSQAALIRYFYDGTRPAVRANQATYAVCEREGWIVRIEGFPFHRATDAGLRAIELEPPVHLFTGMGETPNAVCGEQVTDATRTAPSIDTTTCPICRADYEEYRKTLTAELGKFARREAPYDQEPATEPTRARQQLGMDAAAVLDHLAPANDADDAVYRDKFDDTAEAAEDETQGLIDTDGEGTQVGICRHCGHHIYLYAAVAEREGNWWRGGQYDETGRCGDAEQRTALVVRHEPATTTAERDAALAATVCGNRPPHPIAQCRPRPGDPLRPGRAAVVAFQQAAVELLALIRSGEVNRVDIEASGVDADGRAALDAIQGLRFADLARSGR
ncbi:hypothetical protein E1211_17955 [Micromonospora sp. 15K316]|uniref:hypothetical protein n=1 Tax=Micromonospora sp. 15K316 TaxID=2530376 RepID=UPI00104B220C|nr:hypothetical protein [Micromonospora sp. 15K316]TDC34231.1 hypothetical protein E1211_17955 [Micromonospora sp. 15K316]